MPAQPIFPLSLWEAGTEQPRLPVNDNSLRLEVAFGAALTIANVAPVGPDEGDQHIVGTAWGGFATNSIVTYRGGTWLEFEPFAGLFKTIGGSVYRFDGSAWVSGSGSTPVCIPIAVGDETTALTTGNAKVTFRMPFAMTLTGDKARSSVTTAPTGANLVVDINKNGATLLSTKLSIDATEKTSKTAATPPVTSSDSLADDDEITIDVDQVGSTIAGAGLKVYLIGTRT